MVSNHESCPENMMMMEDLRSYQEEPDVSNNNVNFNNLLDQGLEYPFTTENWF